MRVLFLILFFAAYLAPGETAREMKALPFSGRQIDVALARELYRVDFAAGVATLRAQNVKVMAWNSKSQTLEAWNQGPESFSDSDTQEITAYIRGGSMKFQALTIPDGEGVVKDLRSPIIVIAAAKNLAKNILAHEWLHLQLLRSPERARPLGNDLEHFNDLGARLREVRNLLQTRYGDLKFQSLDAETIKKYARGHEAHLASQYLNSMLALVTLTDELDIHLALRELGLTESGFAEIGMVGAHLNNRLERVEHFARDYRDMHAYRESLSAQAIEYGEETLKLERAVKELATMAVEKIRTTTTPAEFKAWAESRAAGALFEKLTK